LRYKLETSRTVHTSAKGTDSLGHSKTQEVSAGEHAPQHKPTQIKDPLYTDPEIQPTTQKIGNQASTTTKQSMNNPHAEQNRNTLSLSRIRGFPAADQQTGRTTSMEPNKHTSRTSQNRPHLATSPRRTAGSKNSTRDSDPQGSTP